MPSDEVMLAENSLESTNNFVEIDRTAVKKLKPSIEEPPELVLKELPSHLSYAYLDKEEKLPMIIASELTPTERGKTLDVLHKYPKAFAYQVSDIPGISPSY